MSAQQQQSNNTPARRDTANDDDVVIGPAIVTPLHRQDRPTSKVAGAAVAWRKMSHLDRCYEELRLGPRDSELAHRRYSAGKSYTAMWDASQSPSRDSTAALDGAGGGSGTPLAERQRTAFQSLALVEAELGIRDRTILRAVLRDGYSPAEAIRLARLCNDVRVTSRWCEALDAVADAIEKKLRNHRFGD